MSGPRSTIRAFIVLAAILPAGLTASICLAGNARGITNSAGIGNSAAGTAGIASPAAAKSMLGNGPMVITSSALTANRESGTAVFEGSVVAKNNDVTIRSDYMLVKYAEGGDVTSIESTGNVSFVTKSGAITSERATYYAADKKLVFSGNPRAVEGSSVVTGLEITYYIEQEKYTVKDSKVLFEGKKK